MRRTTSLTLVLAALLLLPGAEAWATPGGHAGRMPTGSMGRTPVSHHAPGAKAVRDRLNQAKRPPKPGRHWQVRTTGGGALGVGPAGGTTFIVQIRKVGPVQDQRNRVIGWVWDDTVDGPITTLIFAGAGGEVGLPISTTGESTWQKFTTRKRVSAKDFTGGGFVAVPAGVKVMGVGLSGTPIFVFGSDVSAEDGAGKEGRGVYFNPKGQVGFTGENTATLGGVYGGKWTIWK